MVVVLQDVTTRSQKTQVETNGATAPTSGTKIQLHLITENNNVGEVYVHISQMVSFLIRLVYVNIVSNKMIDNNKDSSSDTFVYFCCEKCILLANACFYH